MNTYLFRHIWMNIKNQIKFFKIHFYQLHESDLSFRLELWFFCTNITISKKTDQKFSTRLARLFGYSKWSPKGSESVDQKCREKSAVLLGLSGKHLWWRLRHGCLTGIFTKLYKKTIRQNNSEELPPHWIF